MSGGAPRLRLWGRLSSINVRKVVVGLRELGLPFERIDAGLSYGVTKTPEYLRKNPNALVPLLEDLDSGFTLWESNVILRYLAVRFAGDAALLPTDLPGRFETERWMDWQQTTINPAGREAFVQLIRTPEDRRDPAKTAASVAATNPLLDMLDALLATRAFIAGDRFTMADIVIAVELHRWRGLPLPQTPRAHLDDWYTRMLQRPSTHGVLDQPLA
jgi:glutathione S-transferase